MTNTWRREVSSHVKDFGWVFIQPGPIYSFVALTWSSYLRIQTGSLCPTASSFPLKLTLLSNILETRYEHEHFIWIEKFKVELIQKYLTWNRIKKTYKYLVGSKTHLPGKLESKNQKKKNIESTESFPSSFINMVSVDSMFKHI